MNENNFTGSRPVTESSTGSAPAESYSVPDLQETRKQAWSDTESVDVPITEPSVQVLQAAEKERSSNRSVLGPIILGPRFVTEEENQIRIEHGKTIVKTIVDKCSLDTHRTDTQLRTSLKELKKLYYQFKDLPQDRTIRSRYEIGKCVANGGAVELLCGIVRDYLTSDWLRCPGNLAQSDFEGLHLASFTLFNFSDSTPAISAAAAAVPGYFSLIAEQLKRSFDKLSSGKAFTDQDDLITRHMLGFTNNCSSVDAARKIQRAEGYTDVLLPYLSATVKVERYKLSAILALANIVDEKESELLNTDVDAIKFLLAMLETALATPDRRNMSWSAKELAHGVAKLASNDYNKKILVDKGALPLLLKLSLVPNEKEQLEAVGALWVLSFDESNKDVIIQQSEILDRITELRESTDPAVSIAAQGVLWNLREKLNRARHNNDINEDCIDARNRSLSSGSTGELEKNRASAKHLMISYQWNCQPTVCKIRDHLDERGYRTWLDVDKMKGSTLEAMGMAVEGSAAFLMCLSHKYKDSPNCRAEAEYAFQRHIPIIPLMMEEGYKPDGWLGILVGTKLYFDFSGKHKFETKLEQLVKEVGENGLQRISISEDVCDSVEVAPIGKTKISEKLKHWDRKNVREWLKQMHINKPSLDSLTGKHLVFLRKLRREAPDTFYGLLKNDLGLASLDDLLNFVEALDDLQ